jgi:phage baseplate assembly protein W
MTWLDYPFRFDGRGLTAATSLDEHVRDLIEQVLLTAPGERVMRPDFGSGVQQLVFAGNSPELAASTQFLVQGALQSTLAGLIAVEAVEVIADEGTLVVNIRYVNLRTRTLEQVSIPLPAATP